MTHLPKAHDFLPPTKSTGLTASTTKAYLRRAVSATLTPDLLVIAAFCLIGLLSTFNMVLRFPDLGAVIEQYNQF
jgi:hypothetical protein